MVTRAAVRIVLTVTLMTALHGCVSTSTSLERGVELYNAGRYDEARQVFDAAVTRNPSSPAAYLDRGAASVRVGEVSASLIDYTRATQLDPADPDAYYNRGNAYVLLDKPAEAAADYSRAIALRPDHAAARFNRGTARAIAGDLVGARADWTYAAMLERDPQTRTAMLMGISPPTEPPLAVVAAPPAPAAEVSALPADARTLAIRGVAKELDGDHAGALGDLRAALAVETDPARRAAIERLLRSLGEPR